MFVEYDRDSVLVPFLLLLFAMVRLFLLLRPDPSTSAGEAQEQAFEIAINGGTMSPEEIFVGEGDRVNLRITADEPLEFHLHGYGLEEEVEPDQPAELTFDATTTGRFEIENHLTDSSLARFSCSRVKVECLSVRKGRTSITSSPWPRPLLRRTPQ